MGASAERSRVCYKLKIMESQIMLILSRRLNEKLVIGENITITLLGIQGNQARIGIDAPKDISVHREEIFLRIQAENDSIDEE